QEVRLGESDLPALRIYFANADDPFRLRKGQRTPQHRVNDAENRRASANAERQRKERGYRKGRPLPEDSRRIFKIMPNHFDHRPFVNGAAVIGASARSLDRPLPPPFY